MKFLTLCFVLYITVYLQGFRILLVASNSMSPTLTAGDIILVQPLSHYKKDDIISFKHKSQTITHRIVDGSSAAYRTKGDANTLPDTWRIPPEEIIGVVIAHFQTHTFLMTKGGDNDETQI